MHSAWEPLELGRWLESNYLVLTSVLQATLRLTTLRRLGMPCMPSEAVLDFSDRSNLKLNLSPSRRTCEHCDMQARLTCFSYGLLESIQFKYKESELRRSQE